MKKLAILISAAVLCVTGCNKQDKTDVVVSFYPLEAAVHAIAGNDLSVRDLTPPASEPHDLELTGSDLDSIEGAKLLVYEGGGFQPAAEEAIKNRNGNSFDVLNAVDYKKGDPHFWLDPVEYAKAVQAISDQLQKQFPDKKEEFKTNTTKFLKQLDEVNAEYKNGLANCKSKTIITSHDAFNYLARRYNLQVEGIEGLAPDAEPSAARLAEIASIIRQSNTSTVFTEELLSPKVAQTLARETGARVRQLSPLESVTKSESSHGIGYVEKMKSNLTELRKALGCE